MEDLEPLGRLVHSDIAGVSILAFAAAFWPTQPPVWGTMGARTIPNRDEYEYESDETASERIAAEQRHAEKLREKERGELWDDGRPMNDAARHAQERRWLGGVWESTYVFGGLFVLYLILDRLWLLDLFASVFRWFGQ